MVLNMAFFKRSTLFSMNNYAFLLMFQYSLLDFIPNWTSLIIEGFLQNIRRIFLEQNADLYVMLILQDHLQI